MPIDYPSVLPDFKISKSRSQKQTFRTSQPFVGALYTEKVTDDIPVMWDVVIICRTSEQARQFQAFLREIKGGQPFIKGIWTEEGIVDHEVKFIRMPNYPVQKSPYVWEYSGTIYANKLIQNDSELDYCLIIKYLQDANIIDIAVNELWPVV